MLEQRVYNERITNPEPQIIEHKIEQSVNEKTKNENHELRFDSIYTAFILHFVKNESGRLTNASRSVITWQRQLRTRRIGFDNNVG